ncbi:TPA: hypothetical protein ACV5ZF_002745 [Salmonella enterica]|uniref:Uncharacterized protein n=3 Tax=Salmonella enterica TaxID=28901 RepID=A0A702DJF7_SALDZ|nr:hypothetical protein [Salmonella enterica]EBF9926076.1 hypothetical protein [Salmonella enterica subsp. enterica serovar Braenderup]EBW5059199.1 hypothetical protein [Salmonella enterica subsp. enterica serovar Somone]ECC9156029.1 hypothetical protein [Salmonella enterica subsp. salamae]ECD3767542.1 hypothetical protein [Salmonella enterica subsp. enterica serovar Onderstepoort]EDR6297429.1 hypothetical protein [Salmonella enterica subsp. enterica serovar Berkeley]EDV5019929.1 hypothetical
MKSIADYLDDSQGTGPATGKMFSLYGMQIGKFIGMEVGSNKLTFVHPVNGRMDVPLSSDMPIPVEVSGKEIKGPIMNPVLRDIIQVD